MRTKKSTSKELRLYTAEWSASSGTRPRLEELEKRLETAPGNPVIHAYGRHSITFSAKILPHQEKTLTDTLMSATSCAVRRTGAPREGSAEYRHQVEMRQKSQLISTLKSQVRDLRREISDKIKEDSNVAAVTEAADLRVNALRESMTAQITHLQEERKTLQDQIAEQEQALAEKSKLVQKHEADNETALEQCNQERTASVLWELTYKVQTAKVDMMVAQINTLRAQYNDLEEKYDDIETELGCARVEIFDQKRKHESAIKRKETQIQRLRDRLNTQRQTSSRRGRVVKEQAKELEDLTTNVVPPLRDLVEKLQSRAQAMARRLHTLRGHDSLQERYRQAIVDMQVMHKKIEELEISLSDTETELLKSYESIETLQKAVQAGQVSATISTSEETKTKPELPRTLEEVCKLTSSLNDDRLVCATRTYDALFPHAITEEQIRGLRSREEYVFTRNLEQDLEKYDISTADVTVAVHSLNEMLEKKELDYQMATAAVGATRVSLKRATLDRDTNKVRELQGLCDYANEQRESSREAQKEIVSLIKQIKERDQEYDTAVVTTDNIDQSLFGTVFYTENKDCFKIGIVAPQSSDLMEHPLVREVLSSTGFALRNRGSTRGIRKHNDQYIFMLQYNKGADYDEEYVLEASKKHIPMAAFHTLAKSDPGLLGLDLNLTYIGKLEDAIWQNEE